MAGLSGRNSQEPSVKNSFLKVIGVKARQLLNSVRKELQPLNRKILDHPFITEALEGKLPAEAFKELAKQQYYIVYHDAKSLAQMASRATNLEELEFFSMLFQGDLQALRNLLKLARTLGLTTSELEAAQPIPEAVAYTHFLSWLSLHANPGEQAFAMVVNLPVWGENCSKLSKALKKNYNIKETSFFDAFSGPFTALEEAALKVIEPYAEVGRFKFIALLIQRYEYLFWEALYRKSQAPKQG